MMEIICGGLVHGQQLQYYYVVILYTYAYTYRYSVYYTWYLVYGTIYTKQTVMSYRSVYLLCIAHTLYRDIKPNTLLLKYTTLFTLVIDSFCCLFIVYKNSNKVMFNRLHSIQHRTKHKHYTDKNVYYNIVPFWGFKKKYESILSRIKQISIYQFLIKNNSSKKFKMYKSKFKIIRYIKKIRCIYQLSCIHPSACPFKNVFIVRFINYSIYRLLVTSKFDLGLRFAVNTMTKTVLELTKLKSKCNYH